MNHQRTVRIVGALFLLQLSAAILSYSVLLDPILYHEEFLKEMAQKSNDVSWAMYLDLICGTAIVAIAILLFPILKNYSERMAIWYIGLRILEFGTIIVSGILLMTILGIGIDYTASSPPAAEYLETLATTFRRGRIWTQNMTIITFCLGASVFYSLLYRVRLMPRFIPIWGLLGVILALTEIVAGSFGYQVGMWIYLPLGLNEIFLGFWLLLKGLRLNHITEDQK